MKSQFYVWFRERRRWVPASVHGAGVMAIDQGRPVRLSARRPVSQRAEDDEAEIAERIAALRRRKALAWVTSGANS